MMQIYNRICYLLLVIALLLINSVVLSQPNTQNMEAWLKSHHAPSPVIKQFLSHHLDASYPDYWSMEYGNKIYAIATRKSPSNARLKEASLSTTETLAKKALIYEVILKECNHCDLKNKNALMQSINLSQYSGSIGSGAEFFSWFIDGYTVSLIAQEANKININNYSVSSLDQLKPKYCKYSHKDAYQAAALGNKAAAIEYYEELLAINCSITLEIYIELANLYTKNNELAKAQRILNHISDHNWSSLESKYYEMLGDIYLHIGDEDKAESYYLKAIEEIT